MKSASDIPAWVSVDARSQSEVLGVVLIVGVVLVGAFVVVGLGVVAISGAETQLSDDRAEKTLTQLDSKAGLVALGESDSQRVSLPSDAGEQYRVDEDAGQMWITVTNLTDESDSFEVMNESLGAVYYEREDSTVAYQGGGVWRATENGGSMISPPEFHYRNSTLTLPAVTITGDSTLGSSALIQQSGEQSKFPVPGDPDKLNPLDNHRVEVHVQSEYYMGWASYFTQRTDGDVDLDPDNETVSATLVTPVDIDEITAASASLSAGGEFHVSGTSALDCGESISGDSDVFTSSYNSSLGTGYCDQFEDGGGELVDRLPGTNGDIVYGKDVDISDGSGGSNFYGDIKSGMTVTIDDSEGSGQPDVYGNISYVDGCFTEKEETDCSQRIIDESGGVPKEIDGIEMTNSIDWFIGITIDEIRPEDGEDDLELEDGLVVEAGEYYLESLTLEEDATVEMDTTDGDIILAVEKNAVLEEDATLEVTGSNNVELYIGGDTSGDHFEMKNDATITTPNDDATQFRLYGTEDFDATLGGGGSGNLATYTGVIYAAPGKTGTGTVTLDGAQVFGGILSGQTILDGGSIHYDEALEGETVVSEDARVIRVTYLHVSQNEITISG